MIFTGITIVVLMFSIMGHELAHGFAAYIQGDDTAKKAGRLSLNPLVHIDPVGTIILPLVLYIFHAPLFGWAKPVPIGVNKIRGKEKGFAWVAAMGPMYNILSIIVGVMIFKLFADILFRGEPNLLITFINLSSAQKQDIFLQSENWGIIALHLGFQLVLINGLIGFFNLLPIPPLDGSRLLLPFLSVSQKRTYYHLERYGILIIFLLLYFDILDVYFDLILKFLTIILF